MEDVSQSNTCHKWQVLTIIFALFIVQSNLYAATQGSLGNSSSQGSISISLHIPEVTRIKANIEHVSLSEQAELCLQVINIKNQGDNKFYTIAGLNGELAAIYNAGLSPYEQSAQVIRPNNTTTTDCSYRSDVQTNVHSENQQDLLLMIIAE